MLVLGVGNSFRGDDAAGLLVADRLRARLPAGVALLRTEGDPAGSLDAWSGHDTLFLIDATRSGARPGAVVRLEAHDRPLRAKLTRSSTHAIGVAEAVELARALGTLPPRVVVYGIEGREFGAGAAVSSEVEAAIDDVVARILSEVGDRA